jgi:hypothetical protein
VESPPSTSDSLAFFTGRACFSKAGIAYASDFISMEHNAYGSISFAIASSGDEDQQLNIIQMKKISSLFSWYHHQVLSPALSRWFNLDDNAFSVWCTFPSTHNPGAPINWSLCQAWLVSL